MKTFLKYSKNKKILTKFLGCAVSVIAITAIAGWVFDVPVLKSISPDWISMKFDTALCFFLSGISLYFIARAQEGARDLAQVWLCVTSLIIVLFMGVLFFSALLGVHTGAEDLFIKETKLAAKTVIAGRPSFPTMISFLFLALAGIVTMLNIKNLRLNLKIIGIIIGLTGLVAVMGYVINIPLLYYYIQDVNSAMAIHTAILFILSGVGLLCL